MKVEDIEIHTGTVGFQFEPLRRLEAKCESPTVFSKAPTIEDVNQKLRELAVKIGANAIVEVTYDSGPTMTAWRSVRGINITFDFHVSAGLTSIVLSISRAGYTP